MLKGEVYIGLQPDPPPDQGERGIFLTYSGDTVGGDVRVGYSS